MSEGFSPAMLQVGNRLFVIVDEDDDYYYGSDVLTYEVLSFPKEQKREKIKEKEEEDELDL